MPTKIYLAPETAVSFKGSGGTVALTAANLGSGAGRISAVWDRGTGSKPCLYKWRAVVQWAHPSVAADYAEIVLATSDGTLADGTVGTADAALTAAQKSNCRVIGVVKAETATGATNRIASGIVEIFDRYVSMGFWNASASVAFHATANLSYITLTPYADETQ